MPKSKKYRKKPRGYKRKLANAPHLYNRNEPPHLGYAYNRTNQTYETLAFHRGNQRFQELEQLEALKRLKDRNGMQSSLMAENFKAIESAYYTGDRWKIGAELRGIKERMAPLTKSAPRTKATLSDEGVSMTNWGSPYGNSPDATPFLATVSQAEAGERLQARHLRAAAARNRSSQSAPPSSGPKINPRGRARHMFSPDVLGDVRVARTASLADSVQAMSLLHQSTQSNQTDEPRTPQPQNLADAVAEAGSGDDT